MQICDLGALNLLAGVIKRAKQDWLSAQRSLRLHPQSNDAQKHEGTIIDCERYLMDIAPMMGMDGETFISALKEQEDDHE